MSVENNKSQEKTKSLSIFTAEDLAQAYTDGFREGYKKGHDDGMNDQFHIANTIKRGNNEYG